MIVEENVVSIVTVTGDGVAKHFVTKTIRACCEGGSGTGYSLWRPL